MKITTQEHKLLSAKLISIFVMLKAGLLIPAKTLLEHELAQAKTPPEEAIWKVAANIENYLSTRATPPPLELQKETESLTRLVNALQASLPILPLLNYYQEKILHGNRQDHANLLPLRSLYIELIEADSEYKEIAKQEGLELIKESCHLINGQSHLISFLKTEALPVESMTADLLKQILGQMNSEIQIYMEALINKTNSQSILPNIISTLLSRMDKQTLASRLSALINDKAWANMQTIACVISIAKQLDIPITASLKSHIDKIVAAFTRENQDYFKSMNIADYFRWLRLVSDNSGITVDYICNVHCSAYLRAGKIGKPFFDAFTKEIFNILFQDKTLLQNLINFLQTIQFGNTQNYDKNVYERSLKETIENQLLDAMIIHRNLSQEVEVHLLEVFIPGMYMHLYRVLKEKRMDAVKLVEFIHDVLNREAKNPNSAYLNNKTIRTQFIWLMGNVHSNVNWNKQQTLLLETLPPISFQAMERLFPQNMIRCYFLDYDDKKNVNSDWNIRAALKYLGDNCKKLLKTEKDLATFYRIFYPTFEKEEYLYQYEPLNHMFSSHHASDLLLLWHISLEQGAVWKDEWKKDESRIVDSLSKCFDHWREAGKPKGVFEHSASSFILKAFDANLPAIKEPSHLSRVYYIRKEISSFFSSSKDAANIVANYLSHYMKNEIKQPYDKETFTVYKDEILKLYALFNVSEQTLHWVKKEPILEIIQTYFYKDTKACIDSLFNLEEDYDDIVAIINDALDANILKKPDKNSFMEKFIKIPHDLLLESRALALGKKAEQAKTKQGLEQFSLMRKEANREDQSSLLSSFRTLTNNKL